MRAGKAVNFEETLLVLRDLSQEVQIASSASDAPIWSVDLTARRPRGNAALRKLEAFVEDRRHSLDSRRYDQRLGIATHMFVRKARMGDFAPTGQQLELFDERSVAFSGCEFYSDCALRDTSVLKPCVPAGAITGPGICDSHYLADLESLRKETLRAMKKKKYWHEQYAAGRPFLLPLAGMLAAIEYPLIAEFVSTGNEWRLHLVLLTMLNWARILHASQKKRGFRPLYITEVPVVCRRDDNIAINVGRLDCMEVVEINRRRPTKAQYEVLRRIQRTYECGCRPKGFSAATVCLACITTFGSGTIITVRFRDWKASVGDSPDRRIYRDTFSVKDVADGPFPRHARQIARYDCSLPNDQGMMAVGAYARSDSPVLFEDGIVDYQCHDGAKEHAIAVGSRERSEAYARMIERAGAYAGLRAQVRAFGNDMSNRILAMVGNGVFAS